MLGISIKHKTHIPDVPPVTMYTLPVRSGRESGWKVMTSHNSYHADTYTNFGFDHLCRRGRCVIIAIPSGGRHYIMYPIQAADEDGWWYLGNAQAEPDPPRLLARKQVA
jgi:hypothetical protein